MKHRERRKEIGKMFIDVAKYMLTALFVGRIFTGEITMKMGILVVTAIAIYLSNWVFNNTARKGGTIRWIPYM